MKPKFYFIVIILISIFIFFSCKDDPIITDLIEFDFEVTIAQKDGSSAKIYCNFLADKEQFSILG